MLSENNFSKYLLYAIGEIILVVIGILIALQINNWNEGKKLADSIDKHLFILEQNLVQDQVQLHQSIEEMTNQFNYADSVLLQIQTIIPIDKNLKKYLGKLMLEHRFKPNKNAIEIIIQSNELPYFEATLQTAIQDYYALAEYTAERENIANTQIQTKYENYINENYPEFFQKDSEWQFVKEVLKNDPRSTTEIDKNQFLNDGQLATLLASRYYQSAQLKGFYSQLLENGQTIINLIKKKG